MHSFLVAVVSIPRCIIDEEKAALLSKVSFSGIILGLGLLGLIEGDEVTEVVEDNDMTEGTPSFILDPAVSFKRAKLVLAFGLTKSTIRISSWYNIVIHSNRNHIIKIT